MADPVVDTFDLVDRVVKGAIDDDALRWVRCGFQTWIRSEGAIPLERCLNLPRTRKQRQRLRRDDAIRDAARLLKDELKGPTAYALAQEVAARLNEFIERGIWRRWRELGAPPEQHSKLRATLFTVAQCNEGETLSVRQLQRILDNDLL